MVEGIVTKPSPKIVEHNNIRGRKYKFVGRFVQWFTLHKTENKYIKNIWAGNQNVTFMRQIILFKYIPCGPPWRFSSLNLNKAV